MANIIQIRRDTSANWTAANPTLAQGEQGFEIDTGKLKIGTGLIDWISLDYYSTNNAGVVTFENLLANGDIGSGADQVPAGDHDHDIGDIVLWFENQLI